MTHLGPKLTAVVIAATLLYFGIAAMPPADPSNGFHLQAFGSIPVMFHGRIMPMDSVARHNLMIISGRERFKDPEGKSQPAIKWMLDAMTSPPAKEDMLPKLVRRFASRNDSGASDKEIIARHEDDILLFLYLNRSYSDLFSRSASSAPANQYAVFRIENDEVLELLKLEQRPGNFRYSYNEIMKSRDELIKQLRRVDQLDAKHLSKYDTKLRELGQHLDLYDQLAWQVAPLAVPPDAGAEEWWPLHHAIGIGLFRNEQAVPARTKAFLNLLAKYAKGDVDGFNEAVRDYASDLTRSMPRETSAVPLEVYLNHFQPFYHCCILYVVVFLLACFSWLGLQRELNAAAFWMCVLVFVVHTLALLARMYIMARPPVTNLYSSAIFIGWGAIGVCLFVDYFYRNSIALAAGGLIGGMTLYIASILGMSGDTMEVLQAVLDTNFWLWTHVLSVTIGYVATFVAGFMGIAYILMGIFTTKLARESGNDLSKAIYGVVCFGMLFSFVGTVLGGIWADQSWGRFWGWDPKENGALLIVIWNALILHARWGAMVKQRGIAVLTVLGNIITAWSWFGTNLLGVGLHSYGFMQGAMTWLVIFAGVNLAIAALGLLPLDHWASFRRPARTSQPGSDLTY